jgi:hypothetical protein
MDREERPVYHIGVALERNNPVKRGAGGTAGIDVVLGTAGMFGIELSGGYLGGRIGGKLPGGREAARTPAAGPEMRPAS